MLLSSYPSCRNLTRQAITATTEGKSIEKKLSDKDLHHTMSLEVTNIPIEEVIIRMSMKKTNKVAIQSREVIEEEDTFASTVKETTRGQTMRVIEGTTKEKAATMMNQKRTAITAKKATSTVENIT